jgi:hypothetical protein
VEGKADPAALKAVDSSVPKQNTAPLTVVTAFAVSSTVVEFVTEAIVVLCCCLIVTVAPEVDVWQNAEQAATVPLTMEVITEV